ncbi:MULTISPECIES: ubiquinol-cytochrome c reductase iron-sulfur subunit [Deinococcus]|uniref:Ubiquinol-cytochrome c reductase iron-sulfur subunit n=1 Tax=Deinococcus rufus TaxID=2136097 RepID=A0ABV7ZEQ6_9DEIO|nr:Rieske 2Fe-2S domain-containing protein [Deinococcus sp. AB2017081]WQE94176.1 Rieske 2Fe-2S domain-containing protein [Deinococcus sp. AB2017081]
MKLTRRHVLERWWMLPVAGTLGAFGYLGWYGARVTFGRERAGSPDFESHPPRRVASVAALSAEWSEQTFTYAGRPCTLLRVPQAVSGGLETTSGDTATHLVAYSRVCTHLGCTVNLVRDPEVLAFAFNYRPPQDAPHPRLGCRCHYSVFDPLQAGVAEFGKARAPLPRVRLERRGAQIWATGIEPAPALDSG